MGPAVWQFGGCVVIVGFERLLRCLTIILDYTRGAEWPRRGPFFTIKIVPLSGETYFLGPILVILAKMSAFGPFLEPKKYVSPIKGTISMDIFGPFLSGRTDGRTDTRT